MAKKMKKMNDGKNEVGGDWNLAINFFLTHCKASNLQDISIIWYRDVIERSFQKYLVDNFPKLTPENTTISHIELYIESKLEGG